MEVCESGGDRSLEAESAELNQSLECAAEIESESESESGCRLNEKEIVKVLEVIEKDSVAIAESYTTLFSSLRSALSQVTSSSVDHMQCFSDAAGRIQESALEAATRGNRYINSCLRLNEEMKGTEKLAMQLKLLRRKVDALDSAVNKIT